MPFHADLHVHSKYSRATSRDLDLEHLAFWAARKGIGVVGTGDCVHPAWLAELKDKLTPAGGGIFRLRPEIEAEVFKTLPASCRASVRFMLSTEISTIYKKGERTRKIHHLIYAPDFAAVDRLAAGLARIGNIASDGRPILGVNSRDLLEITLESGPDSYLVPAHIWTPWFAALGSQSGFDSIEECYGDLAGQIFAVETGLSSDPAMNWRVSSLDRYRLTSSSDAHSPGKLGREATVFSCEPDYFAIRRALESGEGYEGTVEFFPEEGKYHLDGHRACGVRLSPSETIALQGLCPVCGGRVTVGVAHRVEALADRSEALAPPTAGAATSLVPLPEILSEVMETGAASQGVARAYDRALAELGPELSLLEDVPIEDIARQDALLGEAVTRLRKGAVIREAGYDGEYGVIRLFTDSELGGLSRGGLLFPAPAPRVLRPAPPASKAPPRPLAKAPSSVVRPLASLLAELDEDQRRAAETVEGPLIVLAGPGAGKTRMLARRIAHLVVERGTAAASCLAVTFTRRATEELRARLAALIPLSRGLCAVHSLHSLGLEILRADGGAIGLKSDFLIAEMARLAPMLAAEIKVSRSRAESLLRAISLIKRTGATAERETGLALAAYRRLASEQNWIDFDDLISLVVELFEARSDIAADWRRRFRHICVDEFQDVDQQQYRLLQLLTSREGNICVIGDPDQAIYGFRGASADCFQRFVQDFPAAKLVRLSRNYRSTGTIVAASAAVIGAKAPFEATRRMGGPLAVCVAADEREEAAFIADEIERLIGGHDLLAANRGGATEARPLSFADFAVLYRTDAQSTALRQAFDAAGIPFKKSSPAPIAGDPAVSAILRALSGQRAAGDLASRIEAAATDAREASKELDAADLAQARWRLLALAASVSDEERLLEAVALATEADFWDARADRVSLLTMHAAKGLEFAVVFVAGLEDGLTPFSFRGPGEAANSERGAPIDGEGEERRLFYVAMTRAKDLLVLTRAERRYWRGAVRALQASPYLARIPQHLVARQSPSPRAPRAKVRQYSLF
jgi:DNA helicase II / ATP-dependent DNA helicase PcrA